MRKNILAVTFLMLSISLYAQEIAIAPTRGNILYKGIENPIKVVVEKLIASGPDNSPREISPISIKIR